ncbi:MAG: 50S ribosomal protein L13 [Candidatus Absconditabacterales bacterium]|nr:50S ribosomal protein L13 [Candidatus Absconditabacterales bacterium]
MNYTSHDLNKTPLVTVADLQKHRQWWVVDATQYTLGRLASRVAMYLLGKHKTHYCDMRDTGDFVVVKNFASIKITGNKLLQKMYYRYSGYKGNLKETNLRDMMKKKPLDVLYYAVRGMLPKNKLRDRRMKRLKVFLDNNTQYDHYKLQSLPIDA